MTITYGKGRAAEYFFLAMTLIATAVSAWLAVLSEDSGAAFIVGAFSLLWFSLAGLLWVAITDPIRLVTGRFDDAARRFVLTAADGPIGALPYGELQSFGLRSEVGGSKQKQVFYIVHVLKHDGGLWDLQMFGDVGLAQELLRELQGTVCLEAAQAHEADGELVAPLPALVRRVDADGVSRFLWSNENRLVDALVPGLFGAALVLGLFGIPGVITGAHLFFQLLGLSVALFIAYRIYKARGRAYQLEVSDRFLTYSTRERGAAGFQAKQVLEVAHVTRLRSSYSLRRTQQERAHQLILVGDDKSRIELELPGMRTSDVLKLEQHLQAELARRGRSVS